MEVDESSRCPVCESLIRPVDLLGGPPDEDSQGGAERGFALCPQCGAHLVRETSGGSRDWERIPAPDAEPQ